MKAILRSSLLFCSLIGWNVFAAGGPAVLKITGTLVKPPDCTINDGRTIGVDFGESLGVNNVASGQYRQVINYNIICESNSTSTLTLAVNGDRSDFDVDNASIVTVERNDLGIKFYLDGAVFPLGERVQVDRNAQPKLEAVLIQRPGSLLREGPFTATATLQVAYQ